MVEPRSGKGTVQKLLTKTGELNFAAQANTDNGLNAAVDRNKNIDTSQYTPSIVPISDSLLLFL